MLPLLSMVPMLPITKHCNCYFHQYLLCYYRTKVKERGCSLYLCSNVTLQKRGYADDGF